MVENEINIPKDILPEPVQDHEMRQDFQGTNYLLFPRRNRITQQVDDVAPDFKNKTTYIPHVSPGSQISHIATNKG